jgi:hypothetical protein
MATPERLVSIDTAPTQEHRVGFARRILGRVSRLLPEDSYFFGPSAIYPGRWKAQDAGLSDDEISAIQNSDFPPDALELATLIATRTGRKLTFDKSE